MAKNYKPVEYSSTTFESRKYYKRQTFLNTDEGISSVQFRSESIDTMDDSGPISYTKSGSHFHLIRGLLNDTGSNFTGYDKVFTHKLGTSGSIIYIPQQYYGEEIKPNSFSIIDDSTNRQIKIIDDGFGNLYSINSVNSRSAASSISSSENYVGNIHYQMGFAVLTETGSWSGSGTTSSDIMYKDVGTGTYKLQFNSTHTIHQNEVVCKIAANEFTATANQTLWTGSNHALIKNVSSSIEQWTPYATSIAFYGDAPNVYGEFTPAETKIMINAGQNTIDWIYPNLKVNTNNIPSQIRNIIGEGVAAQLIENEWEGSLTMLKKGNTYTFNNFESIFEWNITINDYTSMRGVPLIVGHFPRPLKMDKETDLTIIIRYDT